MQRVCLRVQRARVCARARDVHGYQPREVIPPRSFLPSVSPYAISRRAHFFCHRRCVAIAKLQAFHMRRTDAGYRGRLPSCSPYNNRIDRDRTIYVEIAGAPFFNRCARLILADVHTRDTFDATRGVAKFFFCDLSLERMGKLMQLIGICFANFFL